MRNRNANVERRMSNVEIYNGFMNRWHPSPPGDSRRRAGDEVEIGYSLRSEVTGFARAARKA